MSAERDRIEFAAVLGAEGVPADVIVQVLRDARTIHRLAEIACGRELTSTEERRDDRATARIAGGLEVYEIEAHFQYDPRGAVVRLKLPSGRSNDWAAEGYFCVPTR